MEKLNTKVSGFFQTFKNDVQLKMYELSLNGHENVKTNELLQFIFDYQCIQLEEEDLCKKRKRITNTIPKYNRCCANRAKVGQCTRRKKEGEDFCGTHLKATPHGIVDADVTELIAEQTTQKREVWTVEICGIHYYIDKLGNVYHTEDIVHNISNPRIIAKYLVKEGGEYSIPEFGI
jgi:hypothetical protein